MKFSTGLTLSVVLALSLGVSAAPDIAPGGATTNNIIGTSVGDWDLPTGDSDGFASGLLTLGGGFPFFLFTATLPADSVQLIDGKLTGTIIGKIVSFPLPPDLTPFADVSGTWSVTPGQDTGRFRVDFSQGGGPGVPGGSPTFLIGGMRGQFNDPESPFGPDILGSYIAIWRLL